MSVIGRGKGRGFVEVREINLRRPGQTFSSKSNEIINLIDNLTISEITTSAKIDEIVQTINNAVKNSSLKEVFDELHKQALEDRQFGIKLAAAFSDYKVCSISEGNLRSILLQALQKDYEEREEIKQKNVINFRNAVSLFGEVYNSVKISGQPMHFLTCPFLECLEMLLEASEEEDIELVTTQIFINGQKIYDKSPVELENVIMRVRSVLINRNLSARSRKLLLFIIDLSYQRFVPLSGRLHEFYIDEHSINTLYKLLVDTQQQAKDHTVNKKLDHNVNDKDNAQTYNRAKNKPTQPLADTNSVGISMKTPKQGKNLGFGSNDKSPHSAGNEKPTIPRAIRGAGAADSTKDKSNKKSPQSKKDKLTDEQIWSSKQNTSSKVWGHDDRFDKDYA